jgi:hypothetical protein
MLQDAEMILQTFIDVFKSDLSSVYSQTLLRLIARMIKERKFQVHPNILSCLLHLRLRSELDMMRDAKKKGGADRRDKDKKGPKEKGKFKSEIRKKWQTKNQKKRDKEMKEVEKEMGEAAAEVDLEERASVVRTHLSRSVRLSVEADSTSKPKPSKTSLSYTSPSLRTLSEHHSFLRHWRVSPISPISSMSISSGIYLPSSAGSSWTNTTRTMKKRKKSTSSISLETAKTSDYDY